MPKVNPMSLYLISDLGENRRQGSCRCKDKDKAQINAQSHWVDSEAIELSVLRSLVFLK
jgi:hypothetical protein